MKKVLLTTMALFTVLFMTANVANAQPKAKKKKTIEAKAMSETSDVVNDLVHPTNIKDKPAAKKRGDVYGSAYSDIIVDNFTGYYIDIYVDGNWRGTLAPWDKKVTWAIPGNTTLYAKATFDDGSYLYWGPQTTKTGYEYKWNLRNL